MVFSSSGSRIGGDKADRVQAQKQALLKTIAGFLTTSTVAYGVFRYARNKVSGIGQRLEAALFDADEDMVGRLYDVAVFEASIWGGVVMAAALAAIIAGAQAILNLLHYAWLFQDGRSFFGRRYKLLFRGWVGGITRMFQALQLPATAPQLRRPLRLRSAKE